MAAEEPESFERAAEYMRKASGLRLTNEQKLQLYGYFKQANEGECTTAKPGFFDFTGRAKWEAWHSLGKMTKEEAVKQYLVTVSSISPDWESAPTTEGGGEEDEGGGGGGGVGPTVSRLVDTEEKLAEEEKTVFDWCKEGRQDLLRSHLTPDNINNRDSEGMTLLHWACDRGRLNIVDLLVTRGADINSQDDDKQTPLHYGTVDIVSNSDSPSLIALDQTSPSAPTASSCDQADVVTYLLAKGADPLIKDSDDLTPSQVAGDPSTRQLFQT